MADPSDTTPEHDTTTPEDIKQEPPGNPQADPEAVDKGEETLDRVKPY